MEYIIWTRLRDGIIEVFEGRGQKKIFSELYLKKEDESDLRAHQRAVRIFLREEEIVDSIPWAEGWIFCNHMLDNLLETPSCTVVYQDGGWLAETPLGCAKYLSDKETITEARAVAAKHIAATEGWLFLPAGIEEDLGAGRILVQGWAWYTEN